MSRSKRVYAPYVSNSPFYAPYVSDRLLSGKVIIHKITLRVFIGALVLITIYYSEELDVHEYMKTMHTHVFDLKEISFVLDKILHDYLQNYKN